MCQHDKGLITGQTCSWGNRAAPLRSDSNSKLHGETKVSGKGSIGAVAKASVTVTTGSDYTLGSSRDLRLRL